MTTEFYHIGQERWILHVNRKDNTVTIYCQGEGLSVLIDSGAIIGTHQFENKVMVYTDENIYHFILKDNAYLILDLYNNDGEQLENVLSHPFGQEERMSE